MAVLDNHPMINVIALGGGSTPFNMEANQRKLLHDLATAWRGDDVKQSWGSLKALKFCGPDGITKRVYGRPRKFQYSKSTRNNQFWSVQAEFARVDTMAHDDTETYLELTKNAAPVWVEREYGDLPCWLRILVYGPCTNPRITIGDNEVEVTVTVGTGKVLEISSYPWERRVVDSDGYNWRAKMSGDTKYLDQLSLPLNEVVPMQYTTGTGTGQCFVLWRDTYSVL
jgi:hypothetical protein